MTILVTLNIAPAAVNSVRHSLGTEAMGLSDDCFAQFLVMLALAGALKGSVDVLACEKLPE